MNRIYTLLIALFAFSQLHAQTEVTVTDADLGNATYTWTNDNVYLLDGYVFLEEGGLLNIEPGTVVKGVDNPTTGNASALIITRGAQINAIGTADEPIIFTAESDDVDDPEDLDDSRKGLWGGIIILGRAPVGVDGDETNIEGIPSTEGRAAYGGDDPADNSGTLRYVSIRHGGDKLEANNEINGLTLGGVGSATTIDYVEVYANLDDGIEWFGGTVDVKHAVVSYCGDDSFDYDQSWDGKGQFWFSLQDELSNRAGEWDGSEKGDLTPKVTPVISNATFIGAGETTVNEDNNDALRIRDDAAVNLHNSVLTGFARRAIVLDNDSEQDTYQRFLQGDVIFNRNIFFDFGAGDAFADIITTDGGDDNLLITQLNNNDNSITNPSLGGISRSVDGNLDPRPNAGSAALSGAFLINDDFFDPVPYRGAFSNRDNWAMGWTALSDNGYFGDLVSPVQAGEVVVTDSDIEAGQNVRWTADNVYILDGYVFVESGATLIIDAGTVIKGIGSPSNGDASSALIISRGGKIFANGTADEPIIFTAELDDIDDPEDLTNARKGLWGGVIILGNAPVGVDGDASNVEGIPSTEGRAQYGGDDADDDSGVFRYVSIRHGGDKLEANNEINGLTLAGVGSGTLVDYVEVYANLDDGIELFGGTVDVKHAVVSFCGDDSFDYDQSWDGRGQFWFSLQDELSNRAGEWDGSEKGDLTPKVTPVISNATFIGAGMSSVNEDNNDALRIRDDAAVNLHNSVLTGFARRAIVLDNDSEQDTYQRFLQGDVVFNRNVFFDFGAGDSFADIITTDGGDDNLLITQLNDNGNTITDPILGGISREATGDLDPRPDAGSPLNGGAFILEDDYFDPVPYRGAFSNRDNWAAGWTALSDNRYFADLVDPAVANQITVVDNDINAGDDVTWTAENTYLLDGYVFVENGATLTINAGTIIKGVGSPANGDASSALIISQGGRIIANGTQELPIIFTAESDDVDDP
ncbi:MAG: T9SS C-terminal target domain-containing protein, partial [Bacteroidota bacterium]